MPGECLVAARELLAQLGEVAFRRLHLRRRATVFQLRVPGVSSGASELRTALGVRSSQCPSCCGDTRYSP